MVIHSQTSLATISFHKPLFHVTSVSVKHWRVHKHVFWDHLNFYFQSRPSPDLTFAMLQKMCSLMDFKTDDQPSGCFDDASWDRKLCTMEALLKLATFHKCYAVSLMIILQTLHVWWSWKQLFEYVTKYTSLYFLTFFLPNLL